MYGMRKQKMVCDSVEYGSQYGDMCEHDDHAEKDMEATQCGGRQHCTLCPEVVREIRAAIDDELSAVAEYATLARQFRHDPVMQAWITSIAGDEYGHARAFSMVLAAAGCTDEKHCKEEHECKEDHKCKEDRKRKEDHKCRW